MARLTSTASSATRWGSALGIIGVSLTAAHAQYNPDWARNFRVGVLAGFNIKADFRTSGTFALNGSNPGAVGVPGQNHTYDDGYVRVDEFGNASGYTAYWGYQNASQYDPASRTLTMHATSDYTLSGGRTTADADAPQIGLDLAYGGEIHRWNRTRIGWEFGFGWLPIEIKDDSPLDAMLTQTAHSYDVPPGVVPPTAPYNGGFSGSGQPLIFDVAHTAGSGTTNGTVTGARTLDVSLFAFRLGPSFFWDVSPQFGFALGAGPAMGLVTGTYRFNETPGGSARNRGSVDSTEIVFGGYVNAMLTYHAVKNGDFYISAQYMPLGDATFDGPGRSARLDLSGAVYVAAGVNWPF